MGRLATVAEALHTNSVLHPERLAVKCAVTGVTLSHSAFYERCVALGRGLLGRGVPRGAAVAVFGRNSVAHLEVYGAGVLAGYIVVPVNPALGHAEVQEILERTQCAAALGLDEAAYAAQLPEGLPDVRFAAPVAALVAEGCSGAAREAPLEPLAEEDVWAVLFTSGTTTGRQKGVLRTQGGSTAGFVTHTGPLRHFDHRLVGLVAFPLHGISSFFFAFLYLYVGGGMVVVDLLDPAVQQRPAQRLILDHPEVTYVTLSPSLMNGVLAAGPAARDEYARRKAAGEMRVNVVMLTGASAAPVLRRTVRAWFDVEVLVDVYGSTEAGLITMLLPEDLDVAPGSVGKETPGTQLCRLRDPADPARVVDAPGAVGAVYVKTPMMMKGYLPDSDAPPGTYGTLYDADGYFNQGDLACRCDRGFLHLKGRADDMIVLSSGHNIYPIEIEAPLTRFLKEHGACGTPEAYVVGLPANAAADTVAAVIAVGSAAEAARVEGSGGLMAQFAAAHPRHPTRVLVVCPASARQLPRTANGKVRKGLLPQWFA